MFNDPRRRFRERAGMVLLLGLLAAAAGAGEKATREVGLAECAGLALENNLGLKIEKVGRRMAGLEADAARGRYVKLRASFAGVVPEGMLPGALQVRREGRELEVLVNGELAKVRSALEAMGPEVVREEALSLEEVFLVSVGGGRL